MTFFFQMNPIRVILKIVLALLSSIIAVGGCFCSTVQNTSNKARASIIKHVSHGSGGWIKASCSESMHFCKKNIHISNVIKTFLSLHLTVVRGSHSGRWRMTLRSTNRGFVKKNVGRFWYKPRGDWFSFAKVRKLCFCKQTYLRDAHATHTSYIIRRNVRLPRTTVSRTERKVFITFEIWIFFLQKCMDSLQEAFIHPPECDIFISLSIVIYFCHNFFKLNQTFILVGCSEDHRVSVCI